MAEFVGGGEDDQGGVKEAHLGLVNGLGDALVGL